VLFRSPDSKLCDLKFGLLSLKVDLILPNDQMLASLAMGAVSSSFAANADGSFSFDFSLSSLQIDDRITVTSTFPSVVRTIPQQLLQSSSSKVSASRQAFQIMLDRTRNGDSHLVVRGAAIEVVTSPVFIMGMSDFCKAAAAATANNSHVSDHSMILPSNNPFLQESVSGTIDLFFDSNEGKSYHFTSTPQLSTTQRSILDSGTNEDAFIRMSDNLSKALAGAWKDKKRAQRKWTVDLEIHAPILVVPENCTDPQATVLVLDFGRIAMKSKKKTSKKIAIWFHSNTAVAATRDVLDNIESWRIETSNLTFIVGTAHDNDWSPNSDRKTENRTASEAIIEPFSMIFNVGMETNYDLSTPRTCVDGVLPAFSINIHLSHFQKVLGVVSAWSSVYRKLQGEGVSDSSLHTVDSGLQIIEEKSANSELSFKKQFLKPQGRLVLAVEESSKNRGISENASIVFSDVVKYLHASIALRRLSVKLFTGTIKSAHGLEAHLVSAVLTTTMSTDGSSFSRISMGWFWILDRLPTSFPRLDRLIAHSSLPTPSKPFSFGGKYEIIEELERQGVFKDGYEGSAELADIIIKTSSKADQGDDSLRQEEEFDLSVDAKFSSLFINWNPYAIKALLLTKQYIFESGVSSIRDISKVPPSSLRIIEKSNERSLTAGRSSVRLEAQMNKLVISFNSAKDDLPLYILTMSEAKIEVLAELNDNNLVAFVEVGDFRMETPPIGKTLQQYRTLMGLAPNQTTFLLNVKFFHGPRAVASSGLIGVDPSIHESCAEIFLSPMRFVYIHAQILTLVDYVQDGVLGALGATTAASAAAAALEITQAFNGEKMFLVSATSFEFLVPHAAYIQDYFAFHAVRLNVKYRALANFGGGEADVDLSEMSVACNKGISMLKDPVKISIHASIAPNHAPTEEDRAIKVNIDLSEACLYLTKKHFEQMLYVVRRNIQEDDFFLRDKQSFGSWCVKGDDIISSLGSNSCSSGGDFNSNTLNHAGVQALIIKKRILLKIKVEILALVLCRASVTEPFLEIAGVQSDINVALLPDQSQLQVIMTLHNLNVEDRRTETQYRYFRQLFTHIKTSGSSKDVFNLQYLKDEANATTTIEVRVGAPELVVLPDCISEALEFMKVPDLVNMEMERIAAQRNQIVTQSTVAIAVHDSNEEIEATVKSMPIDPKTSRTNISVKTSTCRIVLVNMESTSSCQLGSMENIVVQGKVDVKASSLKVPLSGVVLSNEIRVNGESLEIYTAPGKLVDCPVQIMDPANFSINIAKSFSPESGTQDLLIKAVALSFLDVSFSMQNAVLVGEIAKSIRDSLLFAEEIQKRQTRLDLINDQEPKPLTDIEFDRIENLAFALEHVDRSTSVSRHESFLGVSSTGRESPSGSTSSSVEHQPEMVLSKYYRVHVTVPDVVFTFINDFQGLDAPLFKVRAKNMAGSGQSEIISGTLENPENKAADSCELSSMKFRLKLNSSLEADYFDPSSNSWEKLLLKPWVSTITMQRGDTHRFKRVVKRMATDVDIESQTCLVSFSEQFLVTVGTALRMRSYEDSIRRKNSILIDRAIESPRQHSNVDKSEIHVVATSSYAIDNQIGIPVYYILQPKPGDNSNIGLKCETGTMQYFRFQYPRGDGCGGKRLYGHEGSDFKGIKLIVGDRSLWFPHIDRELYSPRQAHTFNDDLIIFVDVIKSGKATVIRLRSRVHLYNNTSMAVSWAVQNKEGIIDIGVSRGCCINNSRRSSIKNIHADADQKLPSLGVPVMALRNFVASASPAHADAGLTLLISPFQSDFVSVPSAVASFYEGESTNRWGAIALPPPYALVHMAGSEDPVSTMDIICAPVKADESKEGDRNMMIIQVCVQISLVERVHPYVEIFVRPRALLENRLPINIMVRTPAAFTLSGSNSHEEISRDDPRGSQRQSITTHNLSPDQKIEVYSPDLFVPLSVSCDDGRVAGTETGWSRGWIEVPLGRNRFSSLFRCVLPFTGKGRSTGGIEFYVCEESDWVNFQPSSNDNYIGNQSKLEVASDLSPLQDKESLLKIRTVVFSVANYAVDHTGQLLFESDRPEKGNRSGFSPWSAFPCSRLRRRITLLPNCQEKFRMAKLSMEESEGFMRSIPFCVEDISICEGGIQSSAVYWDNSKPSGFFAYRRLSVGNQWEVHVVPEFVLFNGGTHDIIVQKINAFHVSIAAGKMSHFHGAPLEGLVISIVIPEICGETKGIQVDSLGTRIRVVRSCENGKPIGSLAVQTVVGAQDSRLVVKIGEIRLGGLRKIENKQTFSSMLKKDFLRLRIRWSLLEVTLYDTQGLLRKPIALSDPSVHNLSASPRFSPIKRSADKEECPGGISKYEPVAQVKFYQVILDFQRIFKDIDGNDTASTAKDDERSQLSVIVHQTVVIDRTSDKDEVVIESASDASFINLCLRFKGSLDADLIKVDLLSLNLAHSNGKSQSIVIRTSEGFVWRLLDVANRIIVAISDLTGVHLHITDFEESMTKVEAESENDAIYAPPQSDKLFDVKLVTLSPIKLLVSFKRQPQSSRYQLVKDVKFARMVNYFIRKLNFTVENAELQFSGYKTNDVKGPPSRLLDEFRAVYVSRMKYQLLTLITSVSIQEWKTLTARTEGGDEYVEGDVLRMTGHIIGRSAGYMFKKVGEGIGDGLSAVTGSFGENVEKSADMIGLGIVGGAVNSVVSGLGDGVSSSVKGVGSGASKVVKGAGKGVGQIAGGVGGGVSFFAKGIDKGLRHGDGDAVMSGLSDGAASIIAGVGQGLETAFVGAADGVLNVGQGLFNGIGSVSMGIGNAVMGVKPPRKKEKAKREIQRR